MIDPVIVGCVVLGAVILVACVVFGCRAPCRGPFMRPLGPPPEKEFPSGGPDGEGGFMPRPPWLPHCRCALTPMDMATMITGITYDPTMMAAMEALAGSPGAFRAWVRSRPIQRSRVQRRRYRLAGRARVKR